MELIEIMLSVGWILFGLGMWAGFKDVYQDGFERALMLPVFILMWPFVLGIYVTFNRRPPGSP